MKTKESKVSHKSSEFVQVLKKNLGENINLARKKINGTAYTSLSYKEVQGKARQFAAGLNQRHAPTWKHWKTC
ncbi:hypothetical protein [Proteiniphilum sp. X52]|uniref:hypothetical protein n=1 Tax=Proteiniphilum sp. X52 TaxID=2382159 RepID=UPI0011CD5B5C|nr:hypothetical protein [Proteiniphilum sp. X52]